MLVQFCHFRWICRAWPFCDMTKKNCLLGGMTQVSRAQSRHRKARAVPEGSPPTTRLIAHSGASIDMAIRGLPLSGAASFSGSINFMTTIFNMRAPGMDSHCFATFSRVCFCRALSNDTFIPAGREVGSCWERLSFERFESK